jgi:hypothetical protein
MMVNMPGDPYPGQVTSRSGGPAMGMFDELKDKAAKLASEHPDQVEKISDQVIEKAGDAADHATGGKYADKVDLGQDKADDAIG